MHCFLLKKVLKPFLASTDLLSEYSILAQITKPMKKRVDFFPYFLGPVPCESFHTFSSVRHNKRPNVYIGITHPRKDGAERALFQMGS